MTPTLALLVAVLVVWMLVSAWCGYGKRFARFALVLVVGLALNWGWMIWGIGAKPFERPVLFAQIAVIGYAICAFGAGWLVGRLVRQLRSSRVDKDADI